MRGTVADKTVPQISYRVELLNLPDQWCSLHDEEDFGTAIRWARKYVKSWKDGRRVRIVEVRTEEESVWSSQSAGRSMLDREHAS